MLRTILFLLILSPLASFSQGQPEGLMRVESDLWSQEYYLDSTQYKLSELVNLFEVNQQANQLIRKANNHHDLAFFCQISGGFLAVYPLFNDAIGRDPNYNMSLIGIGLLGLSVPLEISARHKASEAVAMFNQHQQKTKTKLKTSVQLGYNSLGLSLRF